LLKKTTPRGKGTESDVNYGRSSSIGGARSAYIEEDEQRSLVAWAIRLAIGAEIEVKRYSARYLPNAKVDRPSPGGAIVNEELKEAFGNSKEATTGLGPGRTRC
jgi:hypothetical protein